MKSRVVAQLISQGSTSASNFFLFAVAARQLRPAEIGVLAVCYVPFSLGLGLIRAYSSEPLVLPAENRERSVATLAPAAVLSVVGSASVLCTSWILDAPVGVWLALAFPVAVFQDIARYLGFARGRVTYVAIADFLWIVCQVPVTLALIGIGAFTLTTSVIGYLAGCVFAFAVMTPVLVEQAVDERKRNWGVDKAGVGLVLDFIAGRGAGDLLVPVAAAFVSLPFAGALRLTQQLLGPINVVQTGLRIETTRQVVRKPHTIARALEVFGRRSTTVLLLSMMFILLASELLSSLFAGSWPLMIGIIPFLYIEKLLEVYSSKKSLQLRLSNLMGVLARTRWSSVVVLFAILLTGSSAFGYEGYLGGLVVGAVLALILWQRSCRGRKFPQRPVSAESGIHAGRRILVMNATSSGYTQYELDVVAALTGMLRVSPSDVSVAPSRGQMVSSTGAYDCEETGAATDGERLTILFQKPGGSRESLRQTLFFRRRIPKRLLVERIYCLVADLSTLGNSVVLVGQTPPRRMIVRSHSMRVQERRCRQMAEATGCQYVSVNDILSSADRRVLGNSPNHLDAVERVARGIIYEYKTNQGE